MELTIEQQIFETLSKAKKVLIALPESITADSLSSGLALAMFLQKMDKDVSVVCSGSLPEHLQFLPRIESVKADVAGGKSLVVVVDISAKKLDEISYQSTEDKVSIFLKPKDGMFTAEDISFSNDKISVDVLVCVGSKSLESFGVLFERHTDLFFETPKINIDNRAKNEYFGAINFVDINATSIAEMLATLFGKYETLLVDEDIATCLLTGIITQTHSFQHAHTTPKAFMKASELVALGGRQQEVIKFIYKTKPLPLLKLWGRALARLKVMDGDSAAYSMLNTADFEKAQSSPQDLPAVMKELLDSLESHNVVGLLAETSTQTVRILTAIHSQLNAQVFADHFGQGSVTDLNSGLYKAVDITLEEISLADAETKFLGAIATLKG